MKKIYLKKLLSWAIDTGNELKERKCFSDQVIGIKAIRYKVLMFVLLLFSSFIAQLVYSQTPTGTVAYTMEIVPRQPYKTLAAMAGKPVDSVNRTIKYLDGLGRPSQMLEWRGSPSAKDIVTHIEYDAKGRESTKYLPYAEKTANDGSFKTTAKATQLAFYLPGGTDTTYKQTNNPFSIAVFENSLTNRIQEQGFPGDVWQPAATRSTSGRTIVTEYGTNVANEVRAWTINASGASSTTFYPAGKLIKTVTKDENWITDSAKGRTVEEFKDFEDRIVLKRTWETKTKSQSTYYVYNDFGDLQYVLPPNFTATTFQDNVGDFNELIYAYRYDNRRRLAEKKIPGSGWQYLVYNQDDLLVLSQDANQRSLNQWIYTKYDPFGRIAITGKFTQTYASQKAAQDSVNKVLKYYEERLGTGEYTNNAFPTIAGAVTSYLTNFYDDYLFTGYNNSALQPVGITKSLKIKGLLTAVRKTRDDGTAPMLTINYYDDYGRIIQRASQSHIGGTDIETISYNFAGNILIDKREHRATSNGTPTTILTTNTYDHEGRPLLVKKKIGAQAEIIQNKSIYNELGQLLSKNLHSEDNGSTFLSTIKLKYNERGWLKGLYSNDFIETLFYQDGGTAQYNGNVAQQRYKNGTAGTAIIDYQYDGLNRLRSGTGTGATLMSENIKYDDLGNITSLKRETGNEIIYKYLNAGKSNKLDSLKGGIIAKYSYDANGNALKDRTGLDFTYNYLNLPKTASKTGTSVIYLYDATGMKLRKSSTVGSILSERNYVDGIEYNMNGTGLGNIDRISTEDGFLLNNSGTYSYNYYLKDHLGNVRVVLKRDASPNIPSVVQRQDYYPFGKTKSILTGGTNKYLYNENEVQEELGNQLDYGARFYDPEVGRWNTIDPLSEKSRRLSPFIYALNNPLRFIDPDGMASQSFLDDIMANSKGENTTWINMGDGNFSKGSGPIVSDREATGNNDNNQQEGDPPPKRNYSFGNGPFKVNYTVSNMYQGIKVYQFKKMRGGITLPPFGIIVKKVPENEWLIQHEYGHQLQYKEVGAINYYLKIGIPSLWNTIENHLDLENGLGLSVPHRKYEAETDANSRAQKWFGPDAPIKTEPNKAQTVYRNNTWYERLLINTMYGSYRLRYDNTYLK